MTDITLDDMKFDCGGQQHVIAFDPPMNSLREARERVVQLDKEALQVLHRSDITINKYIPPYTRLGHFFNFSQCLFAYYAFSSPANFQPGSALYDNVFYHFPGYARFNLMIQPYAFIAMIAVHAFETGMMAMKLQRHGLTPFDSVWWAWAASCFVEGFTSFMRLNALVDYKKKEKAAKKH
jgi:hypothetical protein